MTCLRVALYAGYGMSMRSHVVAGAGINGNVVIIENGRNGTGNNIVKVISGRRWGMVSGRQLSGSTSIINTVRIKDRRGNEWWHHISIVTVGAVILIMEPYDDIQEPIGL
jgi:hypothetical protein